MKAGIQSEWKVPGCFEAVAAAYAEAGQFDEAVKWQKKALEDPAFPTAAGDVTRERLKLYEQAKPYRTPEN